jgi:hypothetical protein
MGLGSNDRQGGVRLRIGISTDDKGRKKAVIGMNCPEGTPGAKAVEKAEGQPALDKNGKQVYRLEYDYVEGKITRMENKETDFGKFLDVTISDGKDVFTLRLERGERYWSDFLQRVPLVDFAKPLRLTPYNFKDEEGKTKAGISILQEGHKIKHRWNKENGYVGGPPQAEYDDDEEQWKFGKRNKWLEENVLIPAQEQLSYSGAPVPKGDGTLAETPADDLNDLPW